MGDDILVTNRAALDEALEIHPFDEESQIDLLLDFLSTLDVDDQFQVFVLNAAHEQKKLHDANIGTAVAYPPRVHAASCDLDEDCTCEAVPPPPPCPKCRKPMRACNTDGEDDHCNDCGHVEPWTPKRRAAMVASGWEAKPLEKDACGDPACPGWCHCESDTYGWEVDVCEDCYAADLHPEFNTVDPIAPNTWDEDLVVAAHDKACDCNMGRALAAPSSRNALPQHRYKSKAEQTADFARRDAIAMKLKEQRRL